MQELSNNNLISPKKIIEDFQNSSIEQILLDYKNGRRTTQSQAGTESESSKDYSGRVIFEFFQNAIDRAEKNIWLELHEDKFIILNDGKEFSIFDISEDVENKKSDFHALNTIHDSNKVPGESVGNKGVGFKSCWNVSKQVTIESRTLDGEYWGFKLFNPVYDSYFSDNNIKNAINRAGGKVPSFYFPKYIVSEKNNFQTDAVTKITLDLNNFDKRVSNLEQKETLSRAREEILSEIKEFIKAKFFFLNQLKGKKEKELNIHITIDNKQFETISSKDDNWHIIDLKSKCKEDFENLKQERNQYLYENIPLSPNIAIAFPPDQFENIESKFYTYLPTKIKCGFNILIHADFALDNARVSIPENSYNNKILELAARMFVNELLSEKRLHNYKSFAKFLMPKHTDDIFSKYVSKELFDNKKIIKILKEVYKTDKNFNQESYDLIFDVIHKWKADHQHGEVWQEYYDRIYNETINFFCDENIYIVFVSKQYKTSLPKKEKNEDDQKHKLFYIDENIKDSKYNFKLLENFRNITLTSTPSINNSIFIKNKIVKENRKVDIVRSIAIELKNNLDLSDNDKENILRFLSSNIDQGFNIDYFEKDNNKRQTKTGTHLARVLLPTIDNGWKSAKRCYFNIDKDIADCFQGFFEVDILRFKNILEIDSVIETLKYFGAWNSIPITEKFELPWNDEKVIQVRGDNFKVLLQSSLLIWNQIKEVSHEKIEKVFRQIQEQEIFFDKFHKVFCNPIDVFLFNDQIKRHAINQAKKDEKFKILFEELNIRTIEETNDAKKLSNQLEKLANNAIIDKTHKTLFKQLTLSLSKCDFGEVSIPLLTDSGYIVSKKLWFADRNSKKYMHYFDSLDFVLFDIEINRNFVKSLGVKHFDPIFELKPDHAKEINNDALKHSIERQLLTELFCLAEEVMHVNRFNKEEAVTRWNNLKIGFAKDVWIEISLDGIEANKVEYIGKGQKNNDVLFKPLSDSARQDKEKVGEFIHDLHGDLPEEIIGNPKFSKFGYVIADGVFRDTALGSVFSDYLKDEDKKRFLKERGIGDIEIFEMNAYINYSILSRDEIRKILKQLNSKFLSLGLNELNWLLIDSYKNSEYSFTDIEKLFSSSDEKIKSVINQLNPKSRNLLHLKNNQEEIQLRYYISTKEKLNDEKFNEIVSTLDKNLRYFNFDIQQVYSAFKIIDDITRDELLIAQILIDNDIQMVSSELTRPDSNPVGKKQFHKDKDTNTRKISESSRLKESENQQKRGLAFEKIFAIKKAAEIYTNQELITDFQEKYKDLYPKEEIKENFTLIELADILQVSKTIGDGLGYDVLEPIIDLENQKIIKINKVEIKSSKGNKTIHFSNNEIEQIYNLKDDSDWRLYHFVDSFPYDRTKVVKDEVVKLIDSHPMNQSDITAENWIISFE